MRDSDFINAIKEAIEHIGSEIKLAEISGIKQPDINRIKNRKTPINNVTIGTLRRLFPDMQIDFFGTGKQRGHVAKIVKMLNRLTSEEQLQIMLDIVANYPHSREEKSKIYEIKE